MKAPFWRSIFANGWHNSIVFGAISLLSSAPSIVALSGKIPIVSDLMAMLDSSLAGVVIFAILCGIYSSFIIWFFNIVSKQGLDPAPFCQEATRLTNYHFQHIGLFQNNPMPADQFDYVWIDFIMTDMRRAVELLYGSHNIQVSLFVDDFRTSGETFLKQVQTSTFLAPGAADDKSLYATFRIGGGGFCSMAYESCQHAMGSATLPWYKMRWRRPFSLINPQYIDQLPINDGFDGERQKISLRKSYLCIPVIVDGLICGVISIDSTDKKCFRNLNKRNSLILSEFQSIVRGIGMHVLAGRYDKRALGG